MSAPARPWLVVLAAPYRAGPLMSDPIPAGARLEVCAETAAALVLRGAVTSAARVDPPPDPGADPAADPVEDLAYVAEADGGGA